MTNWTWTRAEGGESRVTLGVLNFCKCMGDVSFSGIVNVEKEWSGLVECECD